MRSHFVAPCCFVALSCAAVLLCAPESTAQTQPLAAPPAPTASSTALQPLPPPPATNTAVPGPVWPQQPPPVSTVQPQPGTPYGPPRYGAPGYGTPQIPPGYRTPVPGQQQYPGNYPYSYQYPTGYGYPSQYSGPPSLAYEEGKPGPNGYHVESQPRRGLVIAGATTFGSAYLITLLAASAIADDADDWDSSDDDDDESKALPLFIPVLGPFIGIATLDAGPVGSGWLVLDGLTQGAGVAMLIAGLAYPNKRWIRNDLGLEWRLAPVKAGRDGVGMGLAGRF